MAWSNREIALINAEWEARRSELAALEVFLEGRKQELRELDIRRIRMHKERATDLQWEDDQRSQIRSGA